MAMIFCRECGHKHSDKATACPKCGLPNDDTLLKRMNTMTNGKSMVVYLLLLWFLGIFGAHRFYSGKTGTAVAMLLMGTIGWLLIIPGIIAVIWVVYDLIYGIISINHPERVLK